MIFTWLREYFFQEVQELQSQLSDVSITVTATEQNIDISCMIEDLRAEYEGKICKSIIIIHTS